MPLLDVDQNISTYSCVTATDPWLDKSVLDFNIGDPEQFPPNRVSTSRLVFDEETENFITKGTIRAKHPEKTTHTGKGDKLAEEITSGVKIAIIDSVVHIYLTADTIHREKDILRILQILDEYPDTFFTELQNTL